MIDYTKIESDSELIELYRAGDNAVLNYILEKYKPLVIKNAREFFLKGGETEDLIQEGMIGLFGAVGDFDPTVGAPFFSFANMCIRSKMDNAVKADNAQKNSFLNDYISMSTDEVSEEEFANTNENPEKLLIKLEGNTELINKLMDTLSDFEISVFKLHMQGLNYREIADILGKDPKDIDNAKNRIKGKAKKLYE